MLDQVVVDPSVWALRPDFAVLVLHATGVRGGPSDDMSRGLLAAAAAQAVDPATDPHVAAWHDAYRAFGAKPRRIRPSVDALLRRAPAGLPAVNRLVDAYNAVSVRYVLPVGGEDLARYRGAPRLVRATGDEPFDTVAAGTPVTEHPDPGEVVWRDDVGVTCRRWNWRQCVRTRITEETREAVFMLERLEPMPLDRLWAAGDELAELLVAGSPQARITTRLLGPVSAPDRAEAVPAARAGQEASAAVARPGGSGRDA